MRANSKPVAVPTLAALRVELDQECQRSRVRRMFVSTASIVVVAAALTVLVTSLWTPVLKVYGSSMTPTLTEGDLVVSAKGGSFKQGDIVSFYFNNNILVKRVIGLPGDWIDISQNGEVSVNGKILDEPYVEEKALGQCDIKLPYQVPEGRIFVMGDHRSTSVDSRLSSVGCVSEEQVVGKLLVRFWPIEEVGLL